MKIVIFGLSRSGTTTLFYKIKNSLPPDTVCLFEPLAFESHKTRKPRLLGLRKRERHVLAKVLAFRPGNPADVESFSSFEKQIMIVRDPRDRLISRLLYGLFDSEICKNSGSVQAIVELLRLKEASPHSVSLKTLLATFAKLNNETFSFEAWANHHLEHSVRKPLAFHNAHADLFLFKYEDMIDGRIESLEHYLGLSLTGDSAVAPELRRVTRTKSYGGWRDWFTEEDVHYLRPILQPFLDRFYPDADWELNSPASIPCEHCSGYVLRIVNERRASLQLPPCVIHSSRQ